MTNSSAYRWPTDRDGCKTAPRRPSADRIRVARRGADGFENISLSTFSFGNQPDRRRIRSAGTTLPTRQQSGAGGWARKWRGGPSPQPPAGSTATPTEAKPIKSTDSSNRKHSGRLGSLPNEPIKRRNTTPAATTTPTLEKSTVKCKRDLLDRARQNRATSWGDQLHYEELESRIREKQMSWVKDNWRVQRDMTGQGRHTELLHLFRHRRKREKESTLEDLLSENNQQTQRREIRRPRSASTVRPDSFNATDRTISTEEWFSTLEQREKSRNNNSISSTTPDIPTLEHGGINTAPSTSSGFELDKKTDDLFKEDPDPIIKEVLSDDSSKTSEESEILLGNEVSLSDNTSTALSVQKLKGEGNSEYQVGRYPSAANYYTAALELDGTNAALYCNRAAAYLMLHHYEKCLQDCQEAITLDPLYAKAHFRAGKAQLLLYQPRASRRYYHTALQLVRQQNIDNTDSELCGMEERIGSDLKAVGYVEQCRLSAEHGKWGDSLHFAELAADTVKEDAMQHLRLHALIYVDPVMARVELGHSVSVTQRMFEKPDCGINSQLLSDQLVLLAKASFYSGHLYVSAAGQRLKEALQHSPGHKSAVQLLQSVNAFEFSNKEASNAYRAGKWVEAFQSYTACLNIDAANHKLKSITYNNRAAALLMMGNAVEAIRDCTAAINEDCTNVKAYARRSHAQQDLGNIEAAIRDLELASQLNPSYSHELKEVHRKREMLRAATGSNPYPTSRPSSASSSRPASAGSSRRYSNMGTSHSTPPLNNTNFVNNYPATASHTSTSNYYTVLGLNKSSDPTTIMKRYRELALRYHPDRCQSSESRPYHEKMFKEVGEARAVLSDHKLRSDYDIQLACNSLKG